MLSVIYALRRYTECRYAECRYAECRHAVFHCAEVLNGKRPVIQNKTSLILRVFIYHLQLQPSTRKKILKVELKFSSLNELAWRGEKKVLQIEVQQFFLITQS